MLILPSGGPWGPAALQAREDQVEMDLSDHDKKLLLQIARGSIEAHLLNKPAPALGPPPSLCQPRGAFVSLHRRGQLRGCIGYLEAVQPLGETVREMPQPRPFMTPASGPWAGRNWATWRWKSPS